MQFLYTNVDDLLLFFLHLLFTDGFRIIYAERVKRCACVTVFNPLKLKRLMYCDCFVS